MRRPAPSRRVSRLPYGAAAAAALAALAVLVTRPPLPGAAAVGSAPYLYVADQYTLLFDNFEGSTLSDTGETTVTYAAGYTTGSALYLPETFSWVSYPDTVWAANDEGLQESGTIEFYFRPETFVYTAGKPYGLLLTQDERALTPLTGGLPTLAVQEAGGLSWAISAPVAGYDEVTYSTDPPLYPGQWYHLAATWGNGEIKLYLNNTLINTASADSNVQADRFYLGGTGAIALTQGWAARGRFDRFRLSWKPRIEGEFPCALDVRLDSPSGGEALTVPFLATYRAFASDSRPRAVELYADTDAQGFDGTRLASGLAESGTSLIGGNLADSDYYLYALARAGSDTSYHYLPLSVRLTPAPWLAGYLDPTDTTAPVATPPTTTDSFLLVMLNGGTVTAESPGLAANSTGANASYVVRTNLVNARDTAVIYIWTRETAPALLINLRSDTGSLDSGHLPRGIPNSDTGRRAFGATVISLEFLTSNGAMLGDTASTRYIGDTFAYLIEYQFSAATQALLGQIGFNTSAGSPDFAFFYADTYGGNWQDYLEPTLLVNEAAGGGLNLKVMGLTRDLPGGLGFANPTKSFISYITGAACVLEATLPDWAAAVLREGRDWMMAGVVGRLLAAGYYWVMSYL